MGADVTLTMDRAGVPPEGGGLVVLEVRGAGKLQPIELVAAGPIVARHVTAIVARLPRHIAERECAVAQERLREPDVEIRELTDVGPHNCFMVEVELEGGARELCTSHGRKGYPAEDVADDALDELEDFLECGVPVGEHLADQLLLPMALAGGGRFRTLAPLTDHAHTNLATIREFLDVSVRIDETEDVADVTFDAR
jgi:RNA 3'-terminal phosphate cyclase (ATP)